MNLREAVFAVRIISSVAAIIFLLTLVGIYRAVVESSPTHSCSVEGSVKDPYIRANKVVVQPWLGRHEVYGIFVIPLQYRNSRFYVMRMSINGYQAEFRPDEKHLSDRDGDVVAGPEYYVMRRYVPTRIALWFLFTGRFGDLRFPCNWRLEFISRSIAVKFKSDRASLGD